MVILSTSENGMIAKEQILFLRVHMKMKQVLSRDTMVACIWPPIPAKMVNALRAWTGPKGR